MRPPFDDLDEFDFDDSPSVARLLREQRREESRFASRKSHGPKHHRQSDEDDDDGEDEDYEDDEEDEDDDEDFEDYGNYRSYDYSTDFDEYDGYDELEFDRFAGVGVEH